MHVQVTNENLNVQHDAVNALVIVPSGGAPGFQIIDDGDGSLRIYALSRGTLAVLPKAANAVVLQVIK